MANKYKYTRFSRWIHVEIDKLGITKQKFCDESHIAMGMLFRYYTAQQIPKITTYIKICKTLAALSGKDVNNIIVSGIQEIHIDMHNKNRYK